VHNPFIALLGDVSKTGLFCKNVIWKTLPNRLGKLAANLARISSFSHNELNCDAVASLNEESKFFIEWTAMDTGTDRAAELVEVAGWQLSWQTIWVDRSRKFQVANQAKAWANRVLEMLGLLSDAITQQQR
jgi:hypothetical protein